MGASARLVSMAAVEAAEGLLLFLVHDSVMKERVEGALGHLEQQFMHPLDHDPRAVQLHE